MKLSKALTGGYDFSGSFDDTGQPGKSIVVMIEGYSFNCSTEQGTWKQSGSQEKGFKHTFVSTDKGIKLTIDESRNEWVFFVKLQKLNVSLTGVDWSNGIDVVMFLGGSIVVAMNVDATMCQTIVNAIFDNDDDGEMIITLDIGLGSDITIKLQPTFKFKLTYPQK